MALVDVFVQVLDGADGGAVLHIDVAVELQAEGLAVRHNIPVCEDVPCSMPCNTPFSLRASH